MPRIPSSSNFLTKRLRELRLSAGLTQEAFSEISGFTLKVYQHIEAGRRSNLQLKTLDRLAWAYGISLHELFSPNCPNVVLREKPRDKVHRRN